MISIEKKAAIDPILDGLVKRVRETGGATSDVLTHVLTKLLFEAPVPVPEPVQKKCCGGRCEAK